MKQRPTPIFAPAVAALLAAVALLTSACGPEQTAGDSWDGDPADLAGIWRSRDVEPEGRPYLVLELSGVFRVIVETETRAIEVDRGSYEVDGGVLVRLTTRALDPHMVGTQTRNGVYRVTAEELVLEPSRSEGRQQFYARVSTLPEYRELP